MFDVGVDGDGAVQCVGDVAIAVGVMVQGEGKCRVGRSADGNARFEADGGHAACGFVHFGFGVVAVGEDGDAVVGAVVQVPEFVAGGGGSKQQFFGVPAGGVTTVGGVGGTGDVRLAGGAVDMVAAVGGVVRCAYAEVACPFGTGVVVVGFGFHGVRFLSGVCRWVKDMEAGYVVVWFTPTPALPRCGLRPAGEGAARWSLRLRWGKPHPTVLGAAGSVLARLAGLRRRRGGILWCRRRR